eukprot:Gb_28148 [translate_table: standard]
MYDRWRCNCLGYHVVGMTRRTNTAPAKCIFATLMQTAAEMKSTAHFFPFHLCHRFNPLKLLVKTSICPTLVLLWRRICSHRALFLHTVVIWIDWVLCSRQQQFPPPVRWDIRLLTVVYSDKMLSSRVVQGVVASGIAFSVMSWCILKRGQDVSWCIRKRSPLFVTMFSPLLLIIVAVMSSIILDDKLHLGSVVGSVLIVAGFYAVLWGKGKEMEKIVKIPKKDPEEMNTILELPNNSRSSFSNSKEMMMMMIQSEIGVPSSNLKSSSDSEKKSGEIIRSGRISQSSNSPNNLTTTPTQTTEVTADHVAIDCSD